MKLIEQLVTIAIIAILAAMLGMTVVYSYRIARKKIHLTYMYHNLRLENAMGEDQRTFQKLLDNSTFWYDTNALWWNALTNKHLNGPR